MAKRYTELGEIKRGNEIGYKTTSLLIFHACVICSKERWVPYVGGLPRQLMCSYCAVRSPEVRKKMSDSHYGLTLSVVTKKKISVSIKKLSKIRKVKQRLERDIREYMKLCPALGKPTEEDVMVWAEMLGYKGNGKQNGWAKRLIQTATAGLNVQENTQKTSFALYGVENNVPQYVLRKSIDLEVAIR